MAVARKYANKKRGVGGRKKARARTNMVVRKRRAVVRMNRTPMGFPSTRIVKMRYVDSYSLQSGTGAMATKYWRANGCFDPDAGVGGHQPLGFDQWAVFYKKYIVLGSRITVVSRGVALANSACVPVYTGIKKDYDASIATDYTVLKEQGARARLIQPLGFDKFNINSYYSTKKDFKVKNISDNLDRFGASFTALPSEQMYFVHWAQSQDRLSTTNALIFTATIDYIVLCFEPNDLPQS